MRRRGTALAGVAVALPVAAVAAALALDGGSGNGGAAGAVSPTGTALVQRRTLAETLTASGTIGYAGEAAAVARLSGTVTWLPAVGDMVHRGEPLYELGNEPVVLMYGTLPAYRELGEGVADGPDVRELEENLAALDYDPGTVNDEYTSATAEAVSAWQGDLGLPETGAVELGRVTFLPGPRRVTEVEADLGEAIGSGGSLAAGLEGGDPTAVPVAYVPAAEGIEPNAPAPEAPAEAVPEPKEKGEGEATRPPTEAADERRPEAGGDGAEPGNEGEEPVGEGAEASSVPILQTSSTRRVVSVNLEPDQQSLARRGQRVRVILPDGSEARGRIARLAAVESSEESVPGEEAETGVEATIVLNGRKRAPGLEGATVSVVFTQRKRRRVLTVPLTSLLAVGAGRYAVVVVEGAERRRVAVTPGLAADGYVEVRGRGLRPRMRVESGE